MNSLKEIVNKYGECHGLNRGTGYGNSGGDLNKNNYTKFYEKVLEHKRTESMNFLEIGVFMGYGIAAFSDYLKNSKIYGLDLSNKEFNLKKPDLIKMGAFTNNNLVGVYSGDSTNENTWDVEVKTFPMFDIIIDDGLHRLNAQYDTFKNFWPKLNEGGCYVIEDVLPKNKSNLEKYIRESDYFDSVTKFNIEIPHKNVALFFIFK